MRRRQVLLGMFAMVPGIAGCLGREMTVDASDPSSAPGSEWRVRIEAENIAGMRLSSARTDDGTPGSIEFVTTGGKSESSGVRLSPIPDNETDTTPPYWFWNSRVSVEAEIPYVVEDDAAPGEYVYEVTVFADDSPDSQSTSKAFTITIQES